MHYEIHQATVSSIAAQFHFQLTQFPLLHKALSFIPLRALTTSSYRVEKKYVSQLQRAINREERLLPMSESKKIIMDEIIQ